MLGPSGWSFTGNNENRLVAAETPTNVGGASRRRLTFVYDHHGRRRTKKLYTWDDQAQSWVLDTETRFIWLDWLLLEARDITHNRRTDYILGTDLSGTFQGAGSIGGILCSVTTDGDGNTAHQCFLYDFNGNVVNLVDPVVTDSTTATYEYSPFGKLLISTGPAAASNPIRFSTKWQDETGLSYYGYLYYDARVGRWLSRDPLPILALYMAFLNSPKIVLDIKGDFNILNGIRRKSDIDGIRR